MAGLTSTQAPTFTVVSDLGPSPDLDSVTEYFAAIRDLWSFAFRLAVVPDMQPKSADAPKLQLPDTPGLHVIKIRLESPLEVILTSAVESLSPVGYGVGAIIIFERAVRLLMDWQRHRADMRATAAEHAEVAIQIIDTLAPLPPGVPAGSTRLAARKALITLAGNEVLHIEKLDRE